MSSSFGKARQQSRGGRRGGGGGGGGGRLYDRRNEGRGDVQQRGRGRGRGSGGGERSFSRDRGSRPQQQDQYRGARHSSGVRESPGQPPHGFGGFALTNSGSGNWQAPPDAHQGAAIFGRPPPLPPLYGAPGGSDGSSPFSIPPPSSHGLQPPSPPRQPQQPLQLGVLASPFLLGDGSGGRPPSHGGGALAVFNRPPLHHHHQQHQHHQQQQPPSLLGPSPSPSPHQSVNAGGAVVAAVAAPPVRPTTTAPVLPSAATGERGVSAFKSAFGPPPPPTAARPSLFAAVAAASASSLATRRDDRGGERDSAADTKEDTNGSEHGDVDKEEDYSRDGQDNAYGVEGGDDNDGGNGNDSDSNGDGSSGGADDDDDDGGRERSSHRMNRADGDSGAEGRESEESGFDISVDEEDDAHFFDEYGDGAGGKDEDNGDGGKPHPGRGRPSKAAPSLAAAPPTALPWRSVNPTSVGAQRGASLAQAHGGREAPPPPPPSAFSAFGSAFTGKRSRGNDEDGDDGRQAPRSFGAAASPQAPRQRPSQQPPSGAPMPQRYHHRHNVNAAQLSDAANLFRSFLVKLAEESTRESSWHDMNEAFFGDSIVAPGPTCMRVDFTHTMDEFMLVWNQERQRTRAFQSKEMRGEMWTVVFALGCQLNLILHAITATEATTPPSPMALFAAGVQANMDDALTDACAFAKQMNDILVVLYQHESDMLTPYAILPTVLTRVRTTFEEASLRGAFRVGSNMRTVTSKVFSILLKKLKGIVEEETPPSSADTRPRWTLRCKNQRDKHLVMAFASLVYEIRLSEAPYTEDLHLFVEAFHRCFTTSLEERCMLYFSEASQYLQQPLTTPSLVAAADRLASAVATLPKLEPASRAVLGGGRGEGRSGRGGLADRSVDYIVSENRKVLLMYMTAVNLALGKVPRVEDSKELYVPELADIVVAVRSANLPLFDLALRNNGTFFVETCLYNVMMTVRERLTLMLVIKFYIAHGCQKRIDVPELVQFFRFAYTVEEAMAVWLLPLLIKKSMNGLLDQQTLVLSDADPFDGFTKQALLDLAREEYGAARSTLG